MKHFLVSKGFLFCISFFFHSITCSPAPFQDHLDLPLFRRSTPDWTSLNQSLGGTLKSGIPLAEPCYSNYNGTPETPDASQCSQVQANYDDELYIAQNFGGYQNTNWGICQSTGQGCNLNFSNPKAPVPAGSECYQGSISDYYIPVQGVSDVQTALSFAQSNQVPLVIKNSGHDYKGRSSAPGSLALWVYPYKPAITLTKNFIPDGSTAPVGDGVTVGAGHDFEEVYQFAEANNITVVGGSARSVGAAGGWLAGGGHSSLSNVFGLGVDNALQIKAVLPNGTYITANRFQNLDLFFALRGGGGGTFGVVMEVTYRAHPKVTIQVAFLAFIAANQTDFSQSISILTQNANKWADDGWGGYISLGSDNPLLVGLILFNPKLNLSEATASMAPISSFAASNASALTLVNSVVTSPSFYQAYTSYLQPNEEKVAIGGAIASRLIPRSLLSTQNGQQALATALSNISNLITYPTSPFQKDPLSSTYGAPLQILLTTPYSYTPPAGESFADSAVTPAWREATWHVALGQAFANEASVSTIQQSFKVANSVADILRVLAPHSGAYQNEADVFEPDPVGSFWGQANYDELKRIKKEIDAENVLTCWGCIGWDAGDERYGCYPDVEGLVAQSV